jgi:hypothetical protein
MKTKQIYLGHMATLLAGSLIYILFRSSTLKMFSWYDTLGIMNQINKTRAISILYSHKLPDLVLYALPDGFWMFSYMSLTLYIWKNELRPDNIFWIFILSIIAIFSEIGQLFQITSGTFDILDLLMYLSGTILPFIIYKKSITINLIQI